MEWITMHPPSELPFKLGVTLRASHYLVDVFVLKDQNLEPPVVHQLKMAASYILLKFKMIWSKDKL